MRDKSDKLKKEHFKFWDDTGVVIEEFKKILDKIKQSKRNYMIKEKSMKKVSGYINARPLGKFDFEFYVPEDMTNEQIKEKIKDDYECYISFKTEDGYEEITETITRYEKK